MLKRGYIATPSVYVSYSHIKEIMDRYLANIDDVFGIVKQVMDQNKVSELLEGPVAHSGFQRLI